MVRLTPFSASGRVQQGGPRSTPLEGDQVNGRWSALGRKASPAEAKRPAVVGGALRRRRANFFEGRPHRAARFKTFLKSVPVKSAHLKLNWSRARLHALLCILHSTAAIRYDILYLLSICIFSLGRETA